MGDKYCAVLQLVKAKSCTVAGFLPLPVRLLSVATCNLFQGAQSNPGILDLSASCSVYSTITVITLVLASGKYPVGSGFCSRYYVRSGSCQCCVSCSPTTSDCYCVPVHLSYINHQSNTKTEHLCRLCFQNRH